MTRTETFRHGLLSMATATHPASAYCRDSLNSNSLTVGDPLAEVQSQAEEGLGFAKKLRFGFVIDLISVQVAGGAAKKLLASRLPRERQSPEPPSRLIADALNCDPQRVEPLVQLGNVAAVAMLSMVLKVSEAQIHAMLYRCGAIDEE